MKLVQFIDTRIMVNENFILTIQLFNNPNKTEKQKHLRGNNNKKTSHGINLSGPASQQSQQDAYFTAVLVETVLLGRYGSELQKFVFNYSAGSTR